MSDLSPSPARRVPGPEAPGPSGAQAHVAPGASIVEVQGASFSYGELPVLESITLAIERGEFLAVLGPNGSGKTTLLKLITGILAPQAGEVLVFGRKAHELGAERRRIGYLPQVGTINFRFPVTALQVVTMGLYPSLGPGRYPDRAAHETARLALARVGVAELAPRPLAELSGGQRQRVLLARCLVNGPELILLDEPTSGVDTASTEALYELLRALQQGGATLVVVSHDIAVITTYVNRVACLNRRLVAHGQPDQVMGEAILQEMYGCHAMFFGHGPSLHMIVSPHRDR
ncbi:MAG: ABC transporter ATP-binding protein [Candidatus Lambdaproteobacteria bacterium]|nr:ABC transporter ATP-binding protein [Candidatus Lambdaproteobacteria bacterium]